MDITTQNRIRVYIVEDDEVLRGDFERAVMSSPLLWLTGSTGLAREALHHLEGRPALDVLLVDLGLPDGDGTNIIRAQRRLLPQAKALVISMFDDDWRVLTALSAGAQGYLLKDASDEALIGAILEVTHGAAPISPQVARHLLRMFEPGAPPRMQHPLKTQPSHQPSADPLTEREAEILGLVASGQSGPEVARLLGLSLHTVSTHLRNCHSKLGAKTRLQAVNLARSAGQID